MPKKVDRHAKRNDIGKAAIRVFRQLGYHHTRMADIALAARVAKGTLYEYFDYLGTDRGAKGETPISLEDIYGETRALLREMVAQGKDAGEIRHDLDPDATAELLLSIFDGIVLHSVLDTPRCEMERVHQTALEIVSRGMFEGPFAHEENHPTEPA